MIIQGIVMIKEVGTVYLYIGDVFVRFQRSNASIITEETGEKRASQMSRESMLSKPWRSRYSSWIQQPPIDEHNSINMNISKCAKFFIIAYSNIYI